MSNVAIDIRGVSKHYKVYARPQDRLKQMLHRSRQYFTDHEALKPLSLQICRGETVGIVGSNGSGKSTLLQMICGTLTPSSGSIDTVGRISALLELGAGFNPEFSGRENIWLNASILGLSRSEIAAKYDDIVAFSGLRLDFLDRPVKTYSSGMYVRLAFAVAIAVDPDILIVDEALAVGDESFQRKCFARIKMLQKNGTTVLFVSHSSATVIDLCDRAILLDAGEMLLDADPKLVLSQYHRMIFSPINKMAQVRAEIQQKIFSVTSDDVASGGLNSQDNSDEAHDGDALEVPESMVVYESNGALIRDPHIEDMRGQRVHLLTPNEEYVYTYQVSFTQKATGVRFGMMLRTKSGIELCGVNTDRVDGCEVVDGLNLVPQGTEVTVRFTFKACFFSGTYFLNCGCTALGIGDEQGDGHVMYLHRIIDAVMFKVLPKDDRLRSLGIVDCVLEAQAMSVSVGLE